ncbi:2-oxo acid dehydrogenase subunit E2, partial [Devosia sp.]|uniref:2-oxo acid dehydrogenase subunit E2 n=1 Tax=Devosia sp. TaxID=1871048 RepID=UPI002AFF8DA4
MPIDITMPALSPTMEEGKLAKWHVKEGDSVSSGDVIAEIETDKATMEVEAVDEGKIGKILVAEGTDGVKVNAVIAVLLQEGEDASAIGAGAPAAPKAEEKAPAKAEAPKAEAAPAAATKAEAPKPAAAPAKAEGGKVFASPLARRLAKEAGIDIAAITGSGPKGRVVKSDVDAARSGKAPLKASASAPAAATAPTGMSKNQVMALYEDGSYEIVPNDGMRRTVAARLTESKQTVPHFYLTLDCRIEGLLAAREQINAQAPKGKDGKPEYKLSVNDFVMKAWAVALQRVPLANATWAGDSILYHKRSDVAVAVAVPGGLFTPVVKGCDAKSLRQISEEVKDLATRAKSKKLAPHEYQGGSSSV